MLNNKPLLQPADTTLSASMTDPQYPNRDDSRMGMPAGYLTTSVWGHFSSRVHWMVMLTLFGFLSGYIISRYEDALSSLLILTIYMPMIADSGGNAGSQAATVIIRAMAVGELGRGTALQILWKECRVAAMMAMVIAGLAFLKVALLTSAADLPSDLTLLRVGSVIALALAVQVIFSTLTGALVPLAARRLSLDPAVLASPMLTSLVDISGMLIYFGLATRLLGL